MPAEPCPICGKPKDAKFAPFCSRRCADIDLGRWLKGGYVIPGREGEAPSEPNPENNGDEDGEDPQG